jgi:hypothetical protein
MEISVRSRNLKGHILDPARELEIIENVKKYSYGLVGTEISEGIYRQIMEESRSVQEKDLKLIGFQGERRHHQSLDNRTLDEVYWSILSETRKTV